MAEEKITLKTLVVTFDDNTSEESRQEIMDILAHCLDTGKAVFTVETGTEIVKVEGQDGT